MSAFSMTRAVPLIAVLAAACSSSSSGTGGSSGGSSGTLDCSWLSSDNCWKTTIAASESCLPASTEMGTLSADNKTCTYASGATVTFDTALALPLPSDPTMVLWNFTVTANGKSCLALHQGTGNDFSVATSAGTTTTQASAAVYTVSCPSGASYSAAGTSVLTLLSCDAGPLGGLPGTEYSSTATSVTLSLLGASGSAAGGAGPGVAVFNCKK